MWKCCVMDLFIDGNACCSLQKSTCCVIQYICNAHRADVGAHSRHCHRWNSGKKAWNSQKSTWYPYSVYICNAYKADFWANSRHCHRWNSQKSEILKNLLATQYTKHVCNASGADLWANKRHCHLRNSQKSIFWKVYLLPHTLYSFHCILSVIENQIDNPVLYVSLPRSVAKRPLRLRLENEFEGHSKRNRK